MSALSKYLYVLLICDVHLTCILCLAVVKQSLMNVSQILVETVDPV